MVGTSRARHAGCLAVSGSNLFFNVDGGSIDEYTTGGTEVVAPLITTDGYNYGIAIVSSETTSTPEPASLGLFVLGLAGLTFIRRKRAQ